MRINPYSNNLIRLQSYKIEEPDRDFNSFEDLENIISIGFDNRELIPDIYCYIDYFINLNCSFLGIKRNEKIVDDFVICNFKPVKNFISIISSYINILYNNKKLLIN